MEKDGTLIITADKTSKNMDQIWKNIACTQLELKPSSVQIKQNPHSVKNKAAPELHSVKISILTRLVELSINAIQKQRFRNPLPITVKRTVKIKKEDVINPQTKKNNPFYGIARGACIVEVEIDPLIYTIKIRDIWLAIDGGKIYSEKAVIRSLEKQVHNSLSKVLVEKFDDFFGKARGEYNPFYPILDFTKSPKPNIILIPSKNEPKGISRLPVICNGKVVPSCMLAMFQVSGSEIITIEGFSQTTEYKLITQGFEEAGVQMCGYCNTGKILTAYTFFEKKAQPDDTEIIKAYSGTMCRCTNISDIVRGVKNALKLKAGKNI